MKSNGQILAITRRIPNKKYAAVELKPVWKNNVGPKFSWIHLNVNFLSELCEQSNLHLKVLQGNKHSYLLRIVKKNPSQKFPRFINNK